MAVEQTKPKKQPQNNIKSTATNNTDSSSTNTVAQQQQNSINIKSNNNNNNNNNNTNNNKELNGNHSKKKSKKNNKELNHTNGYTEVKSNYENNNSINNIQNTDIVIDILNEENNNNIQNSYQTSEIQNNMNNHQQQQQQQQQQYLQNTTYQQNNSPPQTYISENSMDEPFNSVSSYIASSESGIPDESIDSLASVSFGSFPKSHWDDISVTSRLTLPEEFYIVSIYSRQQYICTPNNNNINNNFTRITTTSPNNNTNGFIIENSNVEITNKSNSNNNDESKKKKRNNNKQNDTNTIIQTTPISTPITPIIPTTTTTTTIPTTTTITVQSNKPTSTPNISQQIQLIQQQQQQQQIAQQLQQMALKEQKEKSSQITTPLSTPIISTPTTPTTTTPTTLANLILSKPEILDQPSPMKSTNNDSVNGNQTKLKKDLEKKILWIKNFDEYIGTLSSNINININANTNTSSTSTSKLTTQIPQNNNTLSKIPSPEPKGLINTSNTCFMNVILQTLVGCNLFLRVFKNIHQVESLSKYPTIYNLHLFYTDYISQTSQSVSSRHPLVYSPPSPVNPKYFNDLIKSFNSKVSPIINNSTTTPAPASSNTNSNNNNNINNSKSSSSYINLNSPPLGTNISKKALLKVQYSMNNIVSSIQQDAQEFLTYLLDLIHEEFLSIVKDVESIKDESTNGTQLSKTTEKEEEKWEEVTGKKGKTAIINNQTQELPKTPVSQIFSGTLRSCITRTGSKDSITVEPFYCVHLDIRPEDITSLDDALKFFMKPETLEGYTCSTKKTEISVSKSMSFESLPRILIFHLKRFAFEIEGAHKIDKLIKYPMNLSMTTANSLSLPKKYSLFSVISHHGKGLSSGHYTCDILQTNGEWMKFDDSNISEVKEQEVLSREAYLLLYQLS